MERKIKPVSVGRGSFVGMVDSGLNLTEFYEMPYKEQEASGMLYVREGGRIFATRDGEIDERAYGLPVESADSELLSLIEGAVGRTFDALLDEIRARGETERARFEREMAYE